MARFSSVLFALFIASAAVAAPVNQRASCGVDRFKIVTTLAATGLAVGKIDTTNPDTATAVAAAKAGLTSAGNGIKDIALALITGGSPPADARNQTQQGLLDAQTALSGITDDTVTADVASASSKLAAAIQDGDDVVADCV
ncbi:hypothetical protein B0H19DRAFT_1170003 [Mycena capillaripes]|nr:hypothetical protein B0H19DRAFT_1170003 [Mycena capillaripes]